MDENEQESEIGLEKHQKSIRFFTINHIAFRHVAKPYKTNGKSMILGSQKTQKAPSGTPLRFFILHSSFFTLLSSFFILPSSFNEE